MELEQTNLLVSENQDASYSRKRNQASLETLKNKLFWLLYKLFSTEEGVDFLSTKKKASYVVYKTLVVLQYLTILWFSDTEIENWKNYYHVWQILEYSRLDVVFLKTKTLGIFSVVFSCVWVVWLLVFVTLVLKGGKRPGSCLSFFIKSFLIKGSELGFVWFSVPFIGLAKFSAYNYTHMREYHLESASELRFSFIGVIMGTLGLFSLVTAKLVKCVLCYDNRHFYYKQDLESRAYSKVELQNSVFKVGIVLLYSFLGTFHEVAYRFIVMSASGLLCLKYLKEKPFFNEISNTVNAIDFLLIFSFAGCFQVGYFLGNSFLVLLMCFILTPFFVFTQINRLKSTKTQCEDLSVDYQLDHYFRELLNSENPGKVIKVIDKLNKNQKVSLKSYLVVWETNYCLDYLDNEGLARIKLSKSQNYKGNLESEFMVFLCTKRFEEAEDQEDHKYLKFQFKLNEIKQKDEKLCFYFLEFWKELSSKHPQKSTIQKLLKTCYSRIRTLETEYESLVKNFGEGLEGFKLYGSFLSELLNNHSKSLKILNKYERLAQKKTYGMGYFENSTGILIVGGSPQNLGKIIHANLEASQLLSVSSSSLIGSELSTFIPYPFNINHEKAMQRYLQNCFNTNIELPYLLFLQNKEGYMVECAIKVKCSAIETEPFFSVLLKRKPYTREIALMSDNGVIIGHSSLLPALLGSLEPNLKNFTIESLIPGLNYSSLVPFEPLHTKIGSCNLAIVLSFKIIKQKKFYIMYFVTDKKEIQHWVEGTESENYHRTQDLCLIDTIPNPERSIVLDVECEEEKQQEFHYKKDNTKSSDLTFEQSIISPSSTVNSHKALRTHSTSLKKHTKALVYFTFLSLLLISAGSGVVIWQSFESLRSAMSTESFLAFGKLLNSFTVVLDSSRKLSLNHLLEVDAELEVSRLESQTKVLDEVYTTISAAKERLSECQLDYLLFEKTIPLYEKSQPTFENLFNLIEKVIRNIEADREFLVSNLAGQTRDYIESSFEALKLCREDFLGSIGESTLPLVVLQSSLVTFCLGVVVVLVVRIDKCFSGIWKSLISNGRTNFMKMHQKALARLKVTHEYTDFKHEISQSTAQITFSEKWKFIRILSIIFGLSLAFNILCVVYIQNNSANIILRSSRLLEKTVKDRYLTKSLSFWAREAALESMENSIYSFLGNNIYFVPPKLEYESSYQAFKELNKNYLDFLLSSNRDDEIKEMFYKKLDSEEKLFKYGVLKGLVGFLGESRNIAYSLHVLLEDLRKLDNQAYSLDKYLEDLSDELFDTYTLTVEASFEMLIWATVTFGILLFLVYLGVFLPFVKEEKTLLKRIVKISKILKL